MENKDTPQNPFKPIILGSLDFLGGCVRVKISVKNTSDLTITDASLTIESDGNIFHFIRCEPEYPEKKGKIQLGNIDPGTDRTIAFYLDPLVCENVGTDINGRVSFQDSSGIPDSAQMETLTIKVICPTLRTEQEINIGRLKELTEELLVQDSKVYIFSVGMELQDLVTSCRDVIQSHDVKHIKTFKTTDERTIELWYYGKTSVTKNDVLIKCALQRVTKSIQIQASGIDPGEITGLLAQIGHDLTKKFENIGKIQPVFNLHIKNFVIQRSDLLDFCDLEGNCSGDSGIENIVVQRSNTASKNNGKRDQSEKEEGESLRREEEQQKQTGPLRRKQDDRMLLKREGKGRPEKNRWEEEMVRGERKEQEISHREEEVKKQDTKEHRYRQKDPDEQEYGDRIEIIPERSRQKIKVKTTILTKPQELSNSGYQEERGVNFEGISVDKLVGSLTHTCKNILYMVDEFPVENGRLLYLASDVVGGKTYYLLTAVVRECEGLTQVLLRANSDNNNGFNGFLNDILDTMRHRVIRARVRELGIISREQVTSIIDSVVQRVEEERARRKREEQEKLPREEVKKREKEEQEHKLKKEEQEEKEQNRKKDPKEAKITDKANHEQESITKADMSANEKKDGLFRIMFLAVVLITGFLALEYWALAPFASDTNQSFRSSSTLPESFTNFNGIEFVLIPAGEFNMGSPLDEANRATNEGPVHNVKISHAFYMGKYEVTQKQWRKVMGNNPSTFKGDNLPVDDVSWNDIQEFIKKLNENEHMNKYRLPTEAQWEYAARAGTKTMYSFGDNGSNLGDYAWYRGNSEGKTHNVGLKKPNPFGLYDMQGNIYEWVQDNYYDSYKFAPQDGSVGEYVSSSRIFRGGSWISIAPGCRLANREDNDQDTSGSNLGFRLLMDL